MKQRKVFYISLASVISAFAVVMLHTNGCFWTFSTERYWLTATIIETVMYFAVPVFFMISGATLIDYRERYTTKQFFAKRIEKTVIPFLVWSAVGVVYLCLKGAMKFELSWAFVKTVLLGIANSKIISIYWFFISLFTVYLCIPLFASVAKEIREKVFVYVVAVAFIFNWMIPFLCQVFEISYTSRIGVPVALDYLMYVLLGYLLHNKELRPIHKGVVYALGLGGLAMHMVGTYILSMEAGYVVQLFKGYTKVPCLLYSVAVFVLMKDIGEKIEDGRIIKFVEMVGSYTFSIYLMHYYVMDIMVHLFDINVTSILYRVGAPFVIFAICIGLTWCVRKIPVLRKIVP